MERPTIALTRDTYGDFNPVASTTFLSKHAAKIFALFRFWDRLPSKNADRIALNLTKKNLLGTHASPIHIAREKQYFKNVIAIEQGFCEARDTETNRKSARTTALTKYPKKCCLTIQEKCSQF